MSPPNDGQSEPDGDFPPVTFVNHLYYEMELLQKPDARKHFLVKPTSEEFTHIARVTHRLVIACQPFAAQRFHDLWEAREALYTTAPMAENDEAEWRRAGQKFVNAVLVFAPVVPHLTPDEPPAPQPPPQPPALDEEGELVLGVLANSPGHRFTAKEIGTALRTALRLRTVSRMVSEKTIRHRLTALIRVGLAERPNGPKGGARATGAGLIHHQVSASGRGRGS
jgi:hypothetical protein